MITYSGAETKAYLRYMAKRLKKFEGDQRYWMRQGYMDFLLGEDHPQGYLHKWPPEATELWKAGWITGFEDTWNNIPDRKGGPAVNNMLKYVNRFCEWCDHPEHGKGLPKSEFLGTL